MGIMTETLIAVSRHMLETVELNRLLAKHDVRNSASGRVMQKAGFRYEGVQRECMFLKGEFADHAVYSLLQSDLCKTI
jgi:ribosomal-protein-alanine N-acetyltransferase